MELNTSYIPRFIPGEVFWDIAPRVQHTCTTRILSPRGSKGIWNIPRWSPYSTICLVRNNAKMTGGGARWPRSQCARREIAEAKQHCRPSDGWPKIYYLEFLRALEGTLSCWSWLYLHLLAPTNPHRACVLGYGPFSLWVIHKEGLGPSSGDINRLMMTAGKSTAVWSQSIAGGSAVNTLVAFYDIHGIKVECYSIFLPQILLGT
jgi:hypothetical protein